MLAHLGGFAATTLLARHLLAPGAAPLRPGGLLGLLALALATGLAALASAAPIGWTARLLAVRWRIPLVAVALGLLSWRAALAAEGLWGLLSAGTLRSVAWLLRAAGYDVAIDPATSFIGIGSFRVLIAPVCSGVDGLGLVLFFQAIWLSMARSRLRLRRSLLLLPLGAAAALAANVLRITTLIVVGVSGRRELAFGWAPLGWILFIAIALASVAVAERILWLRRGDAGTRSEDDGLPPAVAACLAPLLAALATALVTSIWSDGALDLWYGARVVAALAALLLLRRDLPGLLFSAPWVPVLPRGSSARSGSGTRGEAAMARRWPRIWLASHRPVGGPGSRCGSPAPAS